MTAPTDAPIEHLEDFVAHEWCNALLSDPTITQIFKRHVPEQDKRVSNTFFTRTLFAPTAIRAFLSLYRPGSGARRSADATDVFTGTTQLHFKPSSSATEAARQAAKRDITYSADAADAAESLILLSVGEDIDGGIGRLHGGVIASLLDQCMGTLAGLYFDNVCSTSDLKIKYLKPVPTPSVLLCRAKMVREKGRWIETVGVVEDGMGVVYATGEGSFVLGKVLESKM
ncbi:hypothetical protein NX059_010561 [Plenodomus lindquistii]|nr:hypothetical protein NX059_010561 [Plenodomus lindquistii]